jgi:hypothetical protein
MFLYDKKEKDINVYSIKPKREEIVEYKRQLIFGTPVEKRFIRLCTNDGRLAAKLFSEKLLYSWELDFDHADSIYGHPRFSQLSLYSETDNLKPEDLEKRNAILSNYISGLYFPSPICMVEGYDLPLINERVENRFLLVTDPVINRDDNNNYIIENILSLPKELYLLHLLETGRFSDLTNEDITKQLALFDIAFREAISIEELEKIYETGLLKGALSETLEKAETGTLVLKKKR